MVCLPDGEKFDDMFIRFDRIHERNRRTDRRTEETPHDGIDRACIASRGKNPRQGSGQLSGRPSGYKVAAYMAAWVSRFI